MWNVVLEHGIELVFALLGIVLTGYVTQLIDTKVKDMKLRKYVHQLNEIVIDVVGIVNQVYVDDLKGSDWSDDSKQKAFKKAKKSVMAQLPEYAIGFLTSAYGDINEVIMSKIEAEVRAEK